MQAIRLSTEEISLAFQALAEAWPPERLSPNLKQLQMSDWLILLELLQNLQEERDQSGLH